MTWFPDAPQGHESRKVRFDVLPYCTAGLDIGCGPDKVWPHLIGIDSGKDTELFGISMKPDIVVNDAARLPLFASDSVQCVFSSHTLEHIQNYKDALAEWWRVVAPGGYLVLYLPHANLYPNIGQPGSNPDHKHDFMPADIIDAMREIAPDFDLLVNEDRAQGLEYSFLQIYRKGGSGQHYTWAQPKPAKTAGLVRFGGHGDALWASSVAAHLKRDGYHVTAYVASTGGEILAHDPNIDRLIVVPNSVLDDDDLLAYYANEAAKFDKWVNLIGSVEDRLLVHPSDPAFYLSHDLRHQLMNVNYLDMVHDYAGTPRENLQKFYPTEAEAKWAAETRAKLPGPLVVINPAGSGPSKFWPHTQLLMQRLADAGIYSVVLGDLDAAPDLHDIEPYAWIVGKQWPVRHALAYALQADALVATESLIANAVAMEPMLKVIMLSHSSVENLTRDWINTASVEPLSVACYPCHRIHGHSLHFCSRDTNTGASACMASAPVDIIANLLINTLRDKLAA